jgi:hypothetical protein
MSIPAGTPPNAGGSPVAPPPVVHSPEADTGGLYIIHAENIVTITTTASKYDRKPDGIRSFFILFSPSIDLFLIFS